MKLSREWLNEYVEIATFSDDEIANTLTAIGHAVEGTESEDDDTVFEVELTTNRVDAISHHGMAREIAAALGIELRSPIDPDLPERGADVPITIEAPELCSRYAGITIRNVTVAPSTETIRRRLESVGLRPINNVVDITNYVMIAFGHPLHGFDLDRLAGGEIRVRAAASGETIRTLDGIDRKLDESMCVIADAKKPVAIGGVIGGEESEIGSTTRNVLLESAHFDASAIRRTARKLGVSTDASYRFERGVDPSDTLRVAKIAAALIVAEAGGEVTGISDVVARSVDPRHVVLHEKKLREQTAGQVGMGRAAQILRALQFGVTEDGDRLEVEVPRWRSDVDQEMDLVEEVLRIHGFDRVPSSLPMVPVGDVRHDPVSDMEESLRDLLSGSGLAEAITYSFVHARDNALFSDENALEITNQLTENVASMRLSLIPGLLRAVAHNRSYGIRDGGLFEVGRSYHREGNGVRERSVAAFVLFGASGVPGTGARRVLDYFDAKGIVEAAAARHHVSLSFERTGRAWLQDGKAAVARSADRDVAVVGVVAREIAQAFEIRGEVIAAEIDVEALVGARNRWSMTDVSKFPGIPMVLGLMHQPDLSYREIVEAVRAIDVPHLHEVGLWDRFVPEKEQGEVKTTLGMWYQSGERSLTQDEVTELHDTLAAQVERALPVRVIR